MQTAPTATSHQLDSAARPRPATAATAKASPAATSTCRGVAAPEPTSRIGPTRSASVPRRAVGVVVGVVDRDLQGERDDQGEQRRQRPEAVERGGGAGADQHGRERGGQRARAGAGDPLGGGGQVSRAPADGGGHGPPVGLAGVQQRHGRDHVQLARRGGRPEALGDPGPQARQVRARPRRAATTAATTRWPHSSSGRPNTTASATSGCSRSTASTACGATFTPPVMTTSSSRPVTVSRPSSRRPASRVRNQPSANAAGGRRRIEPVAQRQHRAGELHAAVGRPGRRTPSSGLAVVHAAAGGLGHAVGGDHRDARRPARGPAGRGRWPRRRRGRRRRPRRPSGSVSRNAAQLGRHHRRCSGGRPACGRSRRRGSRPRSSTVGGSPASTLRHSTCRPGDRGHRQRQQPAARAAEPLVGGVRRRGERGRGQQHRRDRRRSSRR